MIDIPEMLERIDLVEMVSQYVELEEKGGEYWGISPFTDPPEKTPSFSVRKETNRFYDFSSGIGGTAITFLKHLKHISTREAIEECMRYIGEDGVNIAAPAKMEATKACLRYAKPKKHEKEERGVVLPDDVMLRYLDNPDKLAVWEREGISRASLERFQVKYDPISDRLVYPIRNPDGKIVNIGGRTLDADYKEKKLRKYTYFYPWGTINTLYGLSENMSEIQKKHEVILFEGCKSVLIADTWGIGNTAAILTSHLSPNQAKLLIKLGVNVVFALDEDVYVPDDRNIARLKSYVNVDYIYDSSGLLSPKDSPVDKGPGVFQQLYEGRVRYR